MSNRTRLLHHITELRNEAEHKFHNEEIDETTYVRLMNDLDEIEVVLAPRA